MTLPIIDTPEKYRSFTVRVPQSMYLRMTDLAQKEDQHLNKKVNQLLLLGLGEHINLDRALMRLIKTNMTQDALND